MTLKLCLIVLAVAVAAQALEQCEEEYLDIVGFIKIGSYKGTTKCGQTYGKSYYITQNFKAFWVTHRAICQSYGMEVLSLESSDEQTLFLNMCDKNIQLFEDLTHVGAYNVVGKSTDKWYWVNSGKRVDFPLKFTAGQPDFAGNNEYCLAMGKRPKDFYFNDITCFGYYELKFICQKIDF